MTFRLGKMMYIYNSLNYSRDVRLINESCLGFWQTAREYYVTEIAFRLEIPVVMKSHVRPGSLICINRLQVSEQVAVV